MPSTGVPNNTPAERRLFSTDDFSRKWSSKNRLQSLWPVNRVRGHTPVSTAQHAILTAIGADRPGLVNEVSQFIFQRGGNIADSRMVNLRGQFAMMLLVSGDERAMSDILNDLPQLRETSALHVELRPAAPATRRVGRSAALSLDRHCDGSGRPRASDLESAAHARREHREHGHATRRRPDHGAPVFEMELIMSVLRKTHLSKLRDELGKLCDELNIDWQLAAM